MYILYIIIVVVMNLFYKEKASQLVNYINDQLNTNMDGYFAFVIGLIIVFILDGIFSE